MYRCSAHPHGTCEHVGIRTRRSQTHCNGTFSISMYRCCAHPNGTCEQVGARTRRKYGTLPPEPRHHQASKQGAAPANFQFTGQARTANRVLCRQSPGPSEQQNRAQRSPIFKCQVQRSCAPGKPFWHHFGALGTPFWHPGGPFWSHFGTLDPPGTPVHSNGTGKYDFGTDVSEKWGPFFTQF